MWIAVRGKIRHSPKISSSLPFGAKFYIRTGLVLAGNKILPHVDLMLNMFFRMKDSNRR